MAFNLNGDKIRCTALFYKLGSSGRDYLYKEPFRIVLPSKSNEEGDAEISLLELEQIAR